MTNTVIFAKAVLLNPRYPCSDLEIYRQKIAGAKSQQIAATRVWLSYKPLDLLSTFLDWVILFYNPYLNKEKNQLEMVCITFSTQWAFLNNPVCKIKDAVVFFSNMLKP